MVKRDAQQELLLNALVSNDDKLLSGDGDVANTAKSQKGEKELS